MHSSALRRLLIPTALAVLSALFIALPGSNNTEASHTPGVPSFNFTGDSQFCNGLLSTFGGPAGIPSTAGTDCTPAVRNAAFSANPNHTTFTNLATGQMNYAQDTLVSFLPSSWTVSQGTTAIPLGTAIGGVASGTSLGLLTGACATPVVPEFILWNASVDNSAGNVLAVDPEGTDARFDTMVGATGDDDAFAGKADSDSLTVSKYPSVSNQFFDPDGSGDATGGFSPVTPWARYASLTQVPAGGDYQLLQLFVFQPGALKTAFSANDGNDTHPFSRLDTSYGWTTIVILNDPTATILSPNPISDFCSVLKVEIMLLGDPAGAGTRLTLPADATSSFDGNGTFHAETYVMSTRDRDLDGLETAIDSCPFTANTEDPYTSAGPDSDGLDSSCDPSPGSNSFAGDHDQDGYLNTQDTCPLVPDGGTYGSVGGDPDQLDSENALAYDVGAPDGGPLGDGVGDACDSENGGSDSVSDGKFLYGYLTKALCVGGTDADLDGWCSGTADTNDANAAINGAGATDTDGDGIDNTTEVFMNTDPIIKCTQDPLIPRVHDSWPADIAIDRVINISDVSKVLPPFFGSSPPSVNYSKRIDFDASGVINITDVTKVLPPTFGTSCTGPQD